MNRAAALLATLLATAAPAAAGPYDEAFRVFLEGTARPAASAAGVRPGVFDAAVAGLVPDLKLPDLVPPGSPPKTGNTAFQAEFTGPAAYLAEKKLAALGAGAAKRAKTWGKTLAAVERRTGVPAGIILAIWGKESGFGTAEIGKDAVRTLATQAFMGSRRAEFLPELVAALLILQEEPVSEREMKSSWAGAMGQPQFMPSKYRAFAVDGDGDGRRDIWSSVPDTLASIGNFLKAHGWKAGVPWGVEVVVPDAVACSYEGPDQGHPVADWAGAGVTRTDGGPVSARDVGPTGHLLMPAGRLGPAFLVSENFYVIKDYNESDVYALLVGLVGDRLAGGGRIADAFAKLPAFTRGDVRALQRKLEALGHDVGSADGLVGFRTRVAIGREQEKRGLPVTCFPGPEVFAAIR